MHVKKERTLIHQQMNATGRDFSCSSVGIRRMYNHWIIETKTFGLKFAACSMNSRHRNLCIVLSETRNIVKVVATTLA